MKLTLNYSFYLATYGRSPRGRGGWAFCPSEIYDRKDYVKFIIWSPSMTFGEAKKWFKTEAKRLNLSGDFVVCT
jgi:hypothetical protein